MQDMMPLFKRALQRWEGYVRMSTGATTYSFEGAPDGEFTLVVSGPWGTYKKLFTRRMVWGTSAKQLPPGKRMTKRTCDFIRDVLKGVDQLKANAVHEEGLR